MLAGRDNAGRSVATAAWGSLTVTSGVVGPSTPTGLAGSADFDGGADCAAPPTIDTGEHALAGVSRGCQRGRRGQRFDGVGRRMELGGDDRPVGIAIPSVKIEAVQAGGQSRPYQGPDNDSAVPYGHREVI